MGTMELTLIIFIGFIFIAVVKYAGSFFSKKNVRIHSPERFVYEINEYKDLENQVLLIFSDGYWEVKKEEHTKEWSSEFGTQTFIDLDTEIDRERYKEIMGKRLEHDKFGEVSIKLKYEINLLAETNPKELLKQFR